MIGMLYRALKDNEFDITGRCKCCIGDKWTGHASYCKVGRALEEYEAKLIGDEVKNNLCAAIETMKEFQSKHYDWQYVRTKTEALLKQLECILDSFEDLIEEIKKVEKEEACAG